MKILCAVDGSEFSLWALECVGKLVSPFSERAGAAACG